jgi:hypothetical protein
MPGIVVAILVVTIAAALLMTRSPACSREGNLKG